MRTFGSDPEFMLTKNGLIESAIGIVHGSPDNRINISGHQFYHDNVLAECAIKPSSSKKELLHNIQECLQIYSEMVSPYELLLQASHDFDHSQLDNEEAKTVGCAIEWCAYKIKPVEPPKQQIRESCFRTCGGHVHIGAEVCREDGPAQICSIYMLDLLLGIPSLWLDKDPTSVSRRVLYGQAGRYRIAGTEIEPYGVEYRSLGNFWFKSPKLAALVYDLSMLAIDWCEDGTMDRLWSFDLDLFLEIQEDFGRAYTSSYDANALQLAINTSNLKIAKPFLDMVLELMPRDLSNQVLDMFNYECKSLSEEWRLEAR